MIDRPESKKRKWTSEVSNRPTEFVSISRETAEMARGVLMTLANDWKSNAEYYKQVEQTEVAIARVNAAMGYHNQLAKACNEIHSALKGGAS